MRKLLPLILLCFGAVSACKIDVEPEVYVSDVRSVALGATGITTPVMLSVQVPSVDRCDEYTSSVLPMIGGMLESVVPRGCERVEIESRLLLDAEIPIIGINTQSSDSLFGIGVVTRTDGNIAVSLIMDTDKYERLSDQVYDEFYQRLDLAGSRVAFVLNNDEAGPVSYVVRDVFINGQPEANNRRYELERRRRVEFTLSDVGSAYLEKHGLSVVLVLPKTEDES